MVKIGHHRRQWKDGLCILPGSAQTLFLPCTRRRIVLYCRVFLPSLIRQIMPCNSVLTA